MRTVKQYILYKTLSVASFAMRPFPSSRKLSSVSAVSIASVFGEVRQTVDAPAPPPAPAPCRRGQLGDLHGDSTLDIVS